LAALAVLFLGGRRERRGALLGLAVGAGVLALAGIAALAGKDYVVERNLLPALVPLAAVVALGLGAARARWVGAALAVALCAYWVAFDVYVTRTPNLQRPDWRGAAAAIGPARGPRAIVSGRLGAEPVAWYLGDRALRWFGGGERVSEVDVVGKPGAVARPANLPAAFHPAGVERMGRLSVAHYVSSRPTLTWMRELDHVKTGFGSQGVVLDGPAGLHRRLARAARTVPAGQAEVGGEI
jgi:hypothetical protein